MLDTALAALIAEAEAATLECPVPSTDPYENALGGIVEVKYRKMGFKL